MINLILSRPNFDAEWAYASLQTMFHKDMHVLIMPLYADEGWSSDHANYSYHYRRGSRSYEQIITPFRHYQIPEENIEWFNRYQDSAETAAVKLMESDAVFLIGKHPEEMMRCINEFHLHDKLLQYQGMMIGDAAGSKIMLDEFDTDNEWEEEMVHGLGCLRGFALETGYIEDAAHLERIIHSIEEKGRAVFGCPSNGAVLIQDGHYELLGDAFTCSEDDLDRIYQAFQDARSRQEYYGDNGGW